ncbi:hypothetical protein PoB_000217000 [Plakobranchus ocellatus]|uniref:Uncharacterized protein n=1 Tax=Plakobranchus ocellatus TaxID=259542 RepID=A0AAV3XXW8_9GAST|nr:hypothetical protein PoB_000217000 [Plakobranchus ocellatus]
MTAYQKDTYLLRGTQSRYSPKKKEHDTSMLQYSERMRIINTSRISLGSGLEAEGRRSPGYKDGDKRSWRRNDAFMERRTLQRPDYVQFMVKERRQNDSLPLLSPAITKSRRQRPSSFDEKELQHNIEIIKTRRRPFSFDERELQRNQAVNSQIKSKHRREAFTKPGSPIVVPTLAEDEDCNVNQADGEVRISFVNASDLYELVDIKRQAKNKLGTCLSICTPKLANVSDAIQFVEDIGSNDNKFENHHGCFPLRKKSSTSLINNPQVHGRQENLSVNLNRELVYKKSHIRDKKNIGIENNDDISGEDRLAPIGVFLQQAVSDFATQNVLTVRPKRAKRMSLRKPRLVDIPEDGDSSSQTGQEDRVLPARKQVPQPSGTSLQAIKEVRDLRREDINMTALEPDRGRLLQRPDHGEIMRIDGSSLNSKGISRKHKSRQLKKTVQPDLDLDKLLMTSIYPPVPWNIEGDPEQPSNKHLLLPVKGSPKEKAQRQMKKLIFLRDRPEQHYRRDT